MDMVSFAFWHWWILALLLLGAELLVSGFFCLWLALAGFLTGSLALLLPLSLGMQGVIFALLSMLLLFLWWRYAHNRAAITSDQPLLNKRGMQYVGRIFTLIEPIQDGQGRIKVGDSWWKVQGSDCPLGAKVRVIAVDGTIFKVARVDD